MPLNIDWQQILLHLFNFIILAAGLALLLFRPVRKFMSEREAKYKKAADDHARALAETQALEKEREVRLAALDGELAEREKQSLAVAEAAKSRVLAQARAEADKILDDGRRRAEAERQKYMEGAGEEICDMIVRSAGKLLAAGGSAETDGALYDRYLAAAGEQARKLTEEERADFAERLKNDRGGPVLRRDVAEIMSDAAATAIQARGADGDSAVYDRFLSQVNGGKGDE